MIEVDIVTPVRKLYEGVRATSVRLPSAQGELLVLPGHTELLALLGTGLLSIFRDGNERRFSVSAGFAEVRKDRILVLQRPAKRPTISTWNGPEKPKKELKSSWARR